MKLNLQVRVRSFFSNYGETCVDVSAPGSTLSTVPDDKYTSYVGTSMAAPYVSGLAALIFSQNPELTALEVKEIIMEIEALIEYNSLL